MDHQKSTILLISGTVSVGGCGGQECYNKPNPRVISQMLSSWEHAESNKKCQIHHNLLKYWFTLFHFVLGDPVNETLIQIIPQSCTLDRKNNFENQILMAFHPKAKRI